MNCTICHEPIFKHRSGMWTHTHGDLYCGCGDGSMATPPPHITCPQCGRTSHNPNDVREKYCGNCHQYHDTMGVQKLNTRKD